MRLKEIERYIFGEGEVFWSYVYCPGSQPSPLGRGPLLSFDLCLLLIHSPLGTLMLGVWRKSSLRPCAGLKRTQLPWCALSFSPDSTVATEGRFPLGEGALEAHLSRGVRRVGMGFGALAHMGNMRMNPLKVPLISNPQDWVWCETWQDKNKLPLVLVDTHFFCFVFYGGLRGFFCQSVWPDTQNDFFIKLMRNEKSCHFKLSMGEAVLWNICLSTLRPSKVSKMSQNHFPFCSGSEVPWLPPKIFMPGKQQHTEVLLSSVYEPAPQREMTLCHTGATWIYTPVPGTSKKHNSDGGWAWKKASFVLRHSCPPLTFLWKTLVAWHPFPCVSLAHPCFCTLTDHYVILIRGTLP